jgi:hypothetical protein
MPCSGRMLLLDATTTVDMPQVCLPCAMDTKGKTLYGRMVEGKCLLGPGPQDTSTKKTRCCRLHRASHTVPTRGVSVSQGSPAYGAIVERASQGERYTPTVCC